MTQLLMPPHPIDSQNGGRSTQRIEQLHQLAKDITQTMAQQSEYQQNQALTFLGLYLLSALFTATVTLWLGQKIIRNFMDKITKIANDMQQMAEDPKAQYQYPRLRY